MNAATTPRACSHVTGILFGRKNCPQPGTITCERCGRPVCVEHGVFLGEEPPPPLDKPVPTLPNGLPLPIQNGMVQHWVCAVCDASRRDNDDSGFRYGDSSRAWDRPSSVPAAATGAAAGAALGDEDRAGLDPDKGWHGEAPPGDAGGDDSGGFDAS